MTQPSLERRPALTWALPAILACYFALGGLFAVLVPPWQVPDEPAHYNYARQLAQTGAYPVLAMGDYNQDLISSKIAPPNARPDFSLDAVKYEDHQPPLFYTLAVPAFLLFKGALIPLRLFSLVIGAFVVLFGYLAVRAIFPTHPHIAAFAAAFVALLPQHLYMMAGFNNDSLSEALIALSVLLGVLLINRGAQAADASGSAGRNPGRGLIVLLAVVAGLAFLTKVQAYLAILVAVFAVVASEYRRRPVTAVLLVVGIACLIALPWWMHGLQVYGGTDFMGLQRHNQVVAGQPTTVDWIAQYGWGGLLSRMAQFTFQSFWGQFGWMSIPIDRRFYLLFLAATLISAVLFLAWWAHSLSARARLKGKTATRTGASIYSPFLVLTGEQTLALDMLALLALGALAGFIWYNLQFVQHQGRYLYSGLIPIGAALSLGWHFIVSRKARIQQWLWVVLVVGFVALDAHLLFRVILPAMRG